MTEALAEARAFRGWTLRGAQRHDEDFLFALHTAIRHQERLAGVIALSSYLVLADRLADEAAAANRDLPIFMAHGTADPVVRFEWGDASHRALVANGYRVDWHAYRMEHSVCMEEIEAIGAWLVRTLASV